MTQISPNQQRLSGISQNYCLFTNTASKVINNKCTERCTQIISQTFIGTVLWSFHHIVPAQYHYFMTEICWTNEK